MTFAAEKVKVGRMPLTVCELDLDICSRVYGDGTCTASAAKHNLFRWSEDFTNAVWPGGTAVTVTPNTVTAPDGTVTADTLDDSYTIGVAQLSQQVVVPADNQLYTFSVYLKNSTSVTSSIHITITGGSSLSNFTGIDWSTATPTLISANAGDGVESAGNGWYRFWMQLANDSTNTNLNGFIRPCYGANTDTGIIYAWGAQMTKGANRGRYYKTTAASYSGVIGSECYQTRATCQDPANYAVTTQTYRFSEPMGNLPIGEPMFPVMQGKPASSPTRITEDFGLGHRASVSVKLQDFTHHDRGIDPYVASRLYDPSDQGTFFGRLRARNPYYQGRTMRILGGYITIPFDWANFETREYIIEEIRGPSIDGSVEIIGKDILKLADNDRAKCPAASGGELYSDLNIVGTDMSVIGGSYNNQQDNLLLWTDDFSVDTFWAEAAGSTPIITAHTLEDDDATSSEAITTNTYTCSDGETITASIYIAKDSIPRATRFPGLRIFFTGGTTSGVDVRLDTSTGDTLGVVFSGSATLIGSGAVDSGGYWRIWVTAQNDSSGNNACRPWIYPAIGANASLSVLSVTAIGEITARGVQFERSATLGDYYAKTNGREWVRIGEEIIEYTGKTGAGTSSSPWVLTGLVRTDLTWGSEASDHSEGDSVQQCKAWQAVNARDIIDELLVSYAGVSSGYIDSTQWDDEEARWLSGYNLTTILSEPEGVADLIAEIQEQCRVRIWWDDLNQTIPLKAIVPPAGNAQTIIDDDSNIIMASLKVKDVSKDRVSQVHFYYDVDNYTKDTAGNYKRLYIQADTDAEAATQYGDSRIHEIKSRWFPHTLQGAATQTASRILSSRRNVPREISFSLDAKDAADHATGDIREIDARLIQGADGASVPTRILILEKKESHPGHSTDYIGLTGISTGPFGFIGPGGLANYTAASAADQLQYGFISNASGLYSNGDTGHKII